MSSQIKNTDGTRFRPEFLYSQRPTYTDTAVIAQLSESVRNVLESINQVLAGSNAFQNETLAVLKRIDRRLAKFERMILKNGC